MFLLRKYNKFIPSFRHKTDIQIFDNTHHHLKHIVYHKANKTVNLIKRKKTLFKSFNYFLNLLISNKLNLITKQYIYNYKPYKKIINCQSLSGIEYNLPGIENINIGKILYSYSNLNTNLKKFIFKGFIAYL
jgi:hypothetical protein